MRILITIFVLFVSLVAKAQTVTYDTTINGWTAFVTLREDLYYNTTTDSFPLILFITGLGESSTDTADLKVAGPHQSSSLDGRNPNAPWNGGVTLGNGTHYPVIISIMPPTQSWIAPATLETRLNTIYARYRIKTKAVHLLGYSRGGQAVMRYSSWLEHNRGSKKYNQVTSFHTTRGAAADDADGLPLGNPAKFGHYAANGGRALILTQINDVRKNDQVAKSMNDSLPGSVNFYWTNYGDGGHTSGVQNPFVTSFNFNISSTILASRTGSAQNNSIQLSNPNQNLYQAILRMGDTTLAGPPEPDDIVLSTVGDTTVYWAQWDWLRDDIKLHTTVVNGSPATFSWVRLSAPNTPTVGNQNQQTASINNYVPGYYTYQVTAANGSKSDTKTVTIWVRDLMQKNATTPRPGGPMVFHLGDAIGSGVTASNIYIPNLSTYFQNRVGQRPQAGDTIKLHRNPNNGNRWDYVEVGDFAGAPGYPIVWVPHNGQVVIGSDGVSYFRMGTRDSNYVRHVKVHGLHYKDKDPSASPYGFLFDRRGMSVVNERAIYGFVANRFSDIEVNGYAVYNAGVAFFLKANSSSNLYTQFKYLRHNKVKIHDVYLNNIEGEGFYVGNTAVNGVQSGNTGGPSVRGDSAEIYRAVISGSGWDGLQLSNWGYGNKIYDVAAYRTGFRNQSSQQWSIFLGGNSQGDMWNVASYNSTGGIAALGQGKVKMYNLVIDSVNNGSNDADGMYNTQSNTGTLDVYPAIDPLEVHVSNSWIGNTTRRAINNANNTSTMSPGSIRSNYFLSGANSGASTNASDTISGNATGPLGAASMFGDSAFYKVLQIVRSHPDSMVSFFDIEGELPSPPPTVNAGTDQVITAPTSSATLTGTVTPGAGATINSTVWTRISGSGNIATPNNLTTIVSGLTPGTSIFRLTATDNSSQSSFDEVSITVNLPAAPTANAGSNQTITLPTSMTTLTGSGTGQNITVAWTKVSGPAGGTFTSPTSLTTDVMGLQAGTYVFRLTVTDDTMRTATSNVTITVNSSTPPTPTGNMNFRTRIKI